MARSFPPDVIVLDSESLLHARIAAGKGAPRLLQAKSYRLAGDTFTPSVVTPELANEGSLGDALRRLRVESGKWDRVSLLLPDSWFRINIVEVPQLPSDAKEALDVVRWGLKKTLPIAPDQLRVAYSVLSKTEAVTKLLVVSAVEKTLADLERVCAAAGMTVVLIEPAGLNIWNAITVREAETAKDRLFVYVRENDFTTAVFRGPQPLFIRSRNVGAERSIPQEIRLSASYLRESLGTETFEQCWLAGAATDEVRAALESAFGAPVRAVTAREFVAEAPATLGAYDAELTACTGVFTG